MQFNLHSLFLKCIQNVQIVYLYYETKPITAL